jgi:tetratricopeptide (TPR) repeat protein
VPGGSAAAAEPDLDAHLLESLGDLQAYIGRHPQARSAYAQALAQVPSGDRIRRARLHRKTGFTWVNQEELAQAGAAYDLAEEVLGPEPAQDALAWRRAWLDIQNLRVPLLCCLGGPWQPVAALCAQIEPVALADGTQAQRARFRTSYLLAEIWRTRLVVSDDMLAAARAALPAWQEVGDVQEVADAHWVIGVCCLLRGALDEAEGHLRAAIETMERAGNLVALVRHASSLINLHRQRGQVEEVRRLSRENLALATETGATVFAGEAHAHLAWAAWRDGNPAEAQASGYVALAIWRSAATVDVTQSTALWPLLAVALRQGAVGEALDHARALLAPPQPLLPEGLAMLLEEAIQAGGCGQPESAHASLERALELARELQYL